MEVEISFISFVRPLTFKWLTQLAVYRVRSALPVLMYGRDI